MQNKSSHLTYFTENNSLLINMLSTVLQDKLQNKCNQKGLAGA